MPKYTDVFKTQLVAESRAVGATAPMISKRHNVPVNRIYAWRQDERYQSAASEEPGFTAVEVAADRNGRDQSQTTCEAALRSRWRTGVGSASATMLMLALFWNWPEVWQHDPLFSGCEDLAGGRCDGYAARL